MRRFTQLLLIWSLFAGGLQHVAAFSLGGPAANWQTARLGYNLSGQIWPPGLGWGFGGPMNLGEEFRLNFPTVTYGFSASFINYFGARGVAEIDKAVALLNALPSMDTININDYPLTSQRINHRAQAIGLLDIRSIALSVFTTQMGLADPTRWVFTLRNRWTPTPTSTNYFVIKRNFDPDTWQYSSFINGQLWTYVNILETAAGESPTINQPVDPLALNGFLNAPVTSGVAGQDLLLIGGFWTSLTRDDVGGLRYIYRHNNFNVENAPTNSFRLGAGTAVVGGTTSPWTIPDFGTNTTGGIVAGGNTNFVDLALRAGIGQIKFVKLSQESVVGSFKSNTVAFVDRYITNGVEVTQNLARSQAIPDVLFDAADLQGDDTGPALFISNRSASQAWPSTGNGTTTWGPGVIPPAVGNTPSLTFTFNSVGPTIRNGILNGNFFVSEESNLGHLFLWGSFDGSTDEPFIYPQGSNTEAIEAQVIGGGTGGIGGGGGTGSLVSVWSPADSLISTNAVGTATGGGTTRATP